MIEIINILAVIFSPIIAILITRHLQNRENKRKDKMEIFKILMTGRLYGWDIASIHALNSIEIIFSEDKNVIEQWKKYYASTRTVDIKNMQTQQFKLLEEIANSLGYKDKISWETIQNPYIPQWLAEKMEKEKTYIKGQVCQAEILNILYEKLCKAEFPFFNQEIKK